MRERAARVAAAGLLVLVAGFLAGRAGGLWMAGEAPHARHGIDRYYAVAGLALMHDGCEPLLAGWHLSWGQPVRLRDCR